MSEPIKLHQWTHDGDRVLLVKCVEKGGVSHNGFVWPKAGPVRPVACSTTPDCDSGGLFGWPWGVNIGGGKNPNYQGDWIVFAARPDQVIDLGDKAKVAAATPEEVECEVIFYGDAIGAMIFTLTGRIAWVHQNARGSASSTGESGSASSTGARGSASSTGASGSASSTGARGSASSTGARGSASITGEYATIDVGPHALGCVTSQRWFWRLRAGAVVACRWKDGDTWPAKLLRAEDYGGDGDVVEFVCGEKVL